MRFPGVDIANGSLGTQERHGTQRTHNSEKRYAHHLYGWSSLLWHAHRKDMDARQNFLAKALYKGCQMRKMSFLNGILL
jgi:hypothetical protein